MLDVARVLAWSAWLPLESSWRGTGVPNLPGLYRIRRVGQADLDYIGRTGEGALTLRKRLSMLRGVYEREMPYADAHTAAPSLWALRHKTGSRFEVSLAVVESVPSWRQAVEALAIALWRQQQGRSPTVNFGRMPPGYRKSSANTARLAAAGQRFRGGPVSEPSESIDVSVAPIGVLDGETQSESWCGHAWTDWMSLAAAVDHVPAEATGLYRLRAAETSGLRSVGQGAIAGRLAKDLSAAAAGGGRLAEALGAPRLLECSWVANSAWTARQRLELQTDLVGAHVLYFEHAPAAQFLA